MAYGTAPVDAEELGDEYGHFMRAAELFHGLRRGQPDTRGLKGTSRAEGPVLRFEPLLPSRPAYLMPAVPRDPLHYWWAVFATKLAAYHRLRNRAGLKTLQVEKLEESLPALLENRPAADDELYEGLPPPGEWDDFLHSLPETWPADIRAWLG